MVRFRWWLCLVVAAKALDPQADNESLFTDCDWVEDLDSEHFDELVLGKSKAEGTGRDAAGGGKPEIWFVDIYASWCSHCQDFSKYYCDVASSFKYAGTPVRFGAMNCASKDADDACNTQDISEYPTLRLFNLPGTEQPQDVNHTLNLTKLHNIFGDALKDADISEPPVHVQASTKAVGPTNVYQKPKEADLSSESFRMRLHDAEVSIKFALLNDVVQLGTRRVPGGKAKVFSGKELHALRQFLGILAKWLPSNSTVKAGVAELEAVVADKKAVGSMVWKSAVKEHGLELEGGYKANFKLCTTYTCGLWMLFHTLATSAAPYPRPAASGNTSLEAPGGTAVIAGIHAFVEFFFGCSDCRKHFMQAYASFQTRYPNANSHMSAIWLWRVHLNVTASVHKKNELEGNATLWPTKAMCPECYVKAYITPVYMALHSAYDPNHRPDLPAAAGA